MFTSNVFQSVFHNPYSNHYHQVPNPSSNTHYDIPNGLTVGKQIFISGVPLQSCDRFQINLETSNGTALHINPRFSGYGANTIVRNADIGGWGAEETSADFPFFHNNPFDFVITVHQDRYSVDVNGRHSFDFRHRVPLHEVRRLGLVGNIQVTRILFAGGDHGAHYNPNHINSPALPFSTPIHRGPEPGRMIQISGQVLPQCGRFVINLQNGPQQDPNEIPMHMSVRYNDPSTGSVVVRTNRAWGNWGQEERDGGNPFLQGGYFDLLILVEPHEFKIAVNGQHFTSFRHRNALGEANHLGIYGDVQVHSVRMW